MISRRKMLLNLKILNCTPLPYTNIIPCQLQSNNPTQSNRLNAAVHYCLRTVFGGVHHFNKEFGSIF